MLANFAGTGCSTAGILERAPAGCLSMVIGKRAWAALGGRVTPTSRPGCLSLGKSGHLSGTAAPPLRSGEKGSIITAGLGCSPMRRSSRGVRTGPGAWPAALGSSVAHVRSCDDGMTRAHAPNSAVLSLLGECHRPWAADSGTKHGLPSFSLCRSSAAPPRCRGL